MTEGIEQVDTAVVGGGQAGLAMAKALNGKGLSVIVLEAEARLGNSWRQRYEGLTLFTPREFSGLAGMRMPGDPDGYPDKHEFADYLEQYARYHRLAVRLDHRVSVVTRDEAGRFLLRLENGKVLSAGCIVVAAGAFRNPIRPEWATRVPPETPTFDAEVFNSSTLPKGDVLIVGDGASGRDIAVLARRDHRVAIATGRPRRLLPERILGKSLWWWLQTLGLLRAAPNSAIGRLMQRTDPFPDRKRHLQDLIAIGVDIRPRAVDCQDGKVLFADGRQLLPTAIVWALGYRPDWSFIEISGVVDRQGRLVHQNGVSPVDGLYFVGLPWQRNRASGLVMGVSEDAEFIAGHLVPYVTKL
ncbi:MAG: flavin-containing monooxygenase [Devosia sp.]